MKVQLAIVAVIGIAACGRTRRDAPQPAANKPAGGFTLPAAQRARIGIDTVKPVTYTPVVQATGTVAFNGDRSTQVIASVGGPVTRILAEPGMRVVAGTPLATVASPDFAAAVAAYRKASASAANLERIAALDAQLYANDALARRDLDQARTDAAGAAADLQAAEQTLHALGVDGSTLAGIRAGRAIARPEAIIRAPIAGTVVERLVTPGELLVAGTTPCFTIADLSTVWVMANVFESDLAAVQPGERATITTRASPRPIDGRVQYVGALVDSATRATTVRVLAPNPGDALKRDMYVRVAIQGARPRSGIVVPASAVQRDDQNLPFVFVALRDGSFSRRSVTLGSRVGGGYEVVSGLAAGEAVVTDGALFLGFAESQ